MYSILVSKITPGFNLVKEDLKKIVNKDMSAVVLPWAFPQELDYEKLKNEYFKENTDKYNKYIMPLYELGLKKENTKILNCYDEKNISHFKEIINNSDILILPGGNPEMLYSKVVQETELLYEIKHYKGIVIGESAGCVLQFKRYFITAKNNFYKYFAFYDGFGILNNDFYPDVHSSYNSSYLKHLKKISENTKKDVYAIFNDGAIIVNRETKKIETYGNVIKLSPNKTK